MNKLANLQRLSDLYGVERVPRFEACRNEQELVAAINSFEASNLMWSIRTDWRCKAIEGYNLPFLFLPKRSDAIDLLQKRPDLIAIVSESFTTYLLQGYGIRLDDEHIFVEYDMSHPTWTLRQVLNTDEPETLRHIAIGPRSYVEAFGRWWRSFEPVQVQHWRLDEVYRTMMQNKLDRLEFCLVPGPRLVFW